MVVNHVETDADLEPMALSHLSPSQVLPHIQKLFHQWGIYGQKLTISHEGLEYAFSCTDTAFVVYRLLSGPGNLRGAPGWPVCLVTAEGVIDECSPPYAEEDCYASHLGLADWLAIIAATYGDF